MAGPRTFKIDLSTTKKKPLEQVDIEQLIKKTAESVAHTIYLQLNIDKENDTTLFKKPTKKAQLIKLAKKYQIGDSLDSESEHEYESESDYEYKASPNNDELKRAIKFLYKATHLIPNLSDRKQIELKEYGVFSLLQKVFLEASTILEGESPRNQESPRKHTPRDEDSPRDATHHARLEHSLSPEDKKFIEDMHKKMKKIKLFFSQTFIRSASATQAEDIGASSAATLKKSNSR